jgi:hypothetical protein
MATLEAAAAIRLDTAMKAFKAIGGFLKWAGKKVLGKPGMPRINTGSSVNALYDIYFNAATGKTNLTVAEANAIVTASTARIARLEKQLTGVEVNLAFAETRLQNAKVQLTKLKSPQFEGGLLTASEATIKKAEGQVQVLTTNVATIKSEITTLDNAKFLYNAMKDFANTVLSKKVSATTLKSNLKLA